MNLPHDYAKLFENRVNAYRLLARLYKTEVDQPLFDRLRGMQFPAGCGDDEMDSGYRLIEGFMRHPPLAALTALAADYARVFIGAGASKDNAAAYPYESVYTSPGRLLMQDARDQVLAAYRAKGLEREDSYKVPEDHIALELEFMAHMGAQALRHLASGEDGAFAAAVDEQRRFLAEHILKWALDFCEDVRKYAATDFYLGVSRLTDGFLLMDRDLLNEVAAEMAVPPRDAPGESVRLES